MRREGKRGADEPTATIHVSLVLKDFEVDPDEITRRLGIPPSTAGAKGDPALTRSGRETSDVYRRSFWTLTSGLPSSAAYEEHICALLDAVTPAGPELRAIGPPTVKEIYCTVNPNGPLPLLQLQNQTLTRVAETGCGVVIDVLWIDPEEE